MFFFATVSLFACVYAIVDRAGDMFSVRTAIDALIEASNITLVAGYTAHFNRNASVLLRTAWLSNVSLGIFWYSLIVPVLSRRVLR
jgi:hypothetical protein